jgi:hypothetical protein
MSFLAFNGRFRVVKNGDWNQLYIVLLLSRPSCADLNLCYRLGDAIRLRL